MKTFSYLWQYVAELFLEWCYKSKCYRRSKHILCSVTFSPENRAAFEIMSINVMEPEGPQMTTQYGAYAWKRPRARAPALAHTQICNNYCFSTATMIRERASVLR
jgi:hypothetical protein